LLHTIHAASTATRMVARVGTCVPSHSYKVKVKVKHVIITSLSVRQQAVSYMIPGVITFQCELPMMASSLA